MKQIKMGAISYAKMCKLMQEGVYTCEDLAEMTGLHVVTVYQYARELQTEGVAHITHYEPDALGRHNIKVYKLGEGVNAKRPKMTGAQRQQRVRDKIYQRQLAHVVAGTGEFVTSKNGRRKFIAKEKT